MGKVTTIKIGKDKDLAGTFKKWLDVRFKSSNNKNTYTLKPSSGDNGIAIPLTIATVCHQVTCQVTSPGIFDQVNKYVIVLFSLSRRLQATKIHGPKFVTCFSPLPTLQS